MKVCTDSCVFGAMIPVQGVPSILDIGTGTGLLSLMLAQRCDAIIDAVEIDADAAKQALQNVSESSWQDRITIHNTSIQDYFKYTIKKYDLIVCNPPFFSDSIKSGSKQKDMALHQTHLSITELMQVTSFMLKENGDAYFLISIYEEERFLKAASEAGLNSRRYTAIYDNPDKLIRYILHMRKDKLPTNEEDRFIIRDKNRNYSQSFVSALKDFYLHL